MAGDRFLTNFQGPPLGKIRPKKWPIFDFLPACSHLKSGQMIFPFKRAFSGPKNRPRNGLSLPTEILAIWADARSNFSLLSFRSWILKFFQGSPLGKMSARCPQICLCPWAKNDQISHLRPIFGGKLGLKSQFSCQKWAELGQVGPLNPNSTIVWATDDSGVFLAAVFWDQISSQNRALSHARIVSCSNNG